MFDSLNHRLPSGPATMSFGEAPGVIPALNSVTTCAATPGESSQSEKNEAHASARIVDAITRCPIAPRARARGA